MIKIRPLCRQDAQALFAIEESLFSIPWSEKAFEELVSRDYCHYLVAEEDGRILGCVGMTLLCGEADVDKVMVDQTAQNKGICSALLDALFQWGEQLQVQAYTLEVRVGNEKAIHVYEKMGFVREGIRPGFYEKPKEDALIMWKRLSE